MRTHTHIIIIYNIYIPYNTHIYIIIILYTHIIYTTLHLTCLQREGGVVVQRRGDGLEEGKGQLALAVGVACVREWGCVCFLGRGVLLMGRSGFACVCVLHVYVSGCGMDWVGGVICTYIHTHVHAASIHMNIHPLTDNRPHPWSPGWAGGGAGTHTSAELRICMYRT